MKRSAAPVVTASERLLKELTKDVADFPQKYRFIVGSRLIDFAIESVLRSKEGFRVADQPARALRPVAGLVDQNDRLQVLIQTAFDLGCFSSAGRFNEVIVIAESIGRQSGAWLREVKSKHLTQQNLDASARLERLETLSTGNTSVEVMS